MAAGTRLAIALGALLALAPSAYGADDLTELNIEDLMQVTVTSASKYEQKQSEVAAAVSVIGGDEIRAFGWRTLGEALASLPGIHLTYDRQYTYLGTRGFGLPGDYNSRVLLAVNGNRLNDVVYDSALLGREFPVDVALIERIEFIAGPGGAVYGQNAMFGVVNVITRDGARLDGGEVAVGWQEPQAQREGRASWGKRLDNGVDVLFSVSALRSRGEDLTLDFPGAGPDLGAGPTDIAGVATRQDGERDEEFFIRVGRGAWSLDLVYGDRRKDDPTASYFADPLVPGAYQRDRLGAAQLQYRDTLAGGSVDLLGRLFVGRERYYGAADYAAAVNYFTGASDWQGGELRVVHAGIAGHKLMLGVEAQDNARIDQTNDDLTLPGREVDIRRDGYRVGVYAQDEWRFAEGWASTLGLRADRNDVTGTELSPRAALIWQAAPATTLKALYGRAHRAPNSFERDYDDAGVSQVANPALAGESIDTFELVADHAPGRELNLRASFYRWNMRDIVTLGIDPLSGLTQYQSGGKVEAAGAELSADQRWASGARLRASVAYQDVDDAQGLALPNSPRWLGKLNYSRRLPGALRLGYELRYEAKRRTLAGATLDDYWLSNLNLVAEGLAKGLEVSLALRNLFDHDHSHPAADTNWQDSLAQDGRSVRLALDLRF